MSTVAVRCAFTSAEDWQCTTLGHIAKIKGGKRLPKGEKFADTVTPFPYIRVTDFANFSVDTSDLRYLTPKTQATIERYTITKTDVYVSIAGTIGITGMIPDRLDGANLTENAAKLVLNKDVIDPRFLMYYLASEVAQTEIRGQTVKNAQPKLALARIASLEVALPFLPEQRKIAAVLGLVQRAIEQQERLIALTTELKKALLHKLFTEGLGGEPQKQTEIGPVPESWEVAPLSALLRQDLQNGAFVRKSQFGKGVLFANVVDMYGDTYVNFDCVDRVTVSEREIALYGLSEGDLLVVRSSLKREGIGQNSVVRPLLEPTIFDCHLIRVAVDSSKLLPEFLSFYWRTPKGKLDLIQRSKTVTMTTLNQAGLSGALVPKPSLNEQKQVIDALLVVESKVQFYQRKRRCLTDLFRTLLQQLMTAQIRVNRLDLPETLTI